MQKKSLTLLLPSLLSGCTAFNATPVPDTTPPALVFVDGQIRESAAIITHTQKTSASATGDPPCDTAPSDNNGDTLNHCQQPEYRTASPPASSGHTAVCTGYDR